MNRCEAPNCKIRTYALTEEQLRLVKNNYVISFHKFPDDPDRRRSWINAAKRPSWKPPLFNSSLCSLHFRDDCFNENNELYDDVVPSIFFDDFRLHMKEVVEKLKPQYYKDALKQCSSSKLNQSLTQLETENDANFLECEEVIVYEDSENVSLGIENIPIIEVDESSTITTDKDALKLPVPVPKLDKSKIDTNNIVDIKIANPDSNTSSQSDVNEPMCIDPVEKVANSSTTINVVAPSSLPKNTINVGLLQTEIKNCASSVTKPSLTTASAKPSIQSSNIVSTPSLWSYAPPGVLPKNPSIPSSSLVKSALSSPPIPATGKPSAVHASSICSTTVDPASITSQTKSTFTSSQKSKPANVTLTGSSNTVAKSPQLNKPINVTSSVFSTTATKTTFTSSITVASKPTTITNKPVTVPSTSLEKSTSSGTFSILEPVTKSIVLQLLNVVKMANTSDANKPKPGQTYSSYLVTSKCVDGDSNEPCRVLPSTTIIENIAGYVRMIKNESFVKPKNVSIICGSPAIFLLKNVIVEECDSNMNCVYVVTTENLLQHLCKMKIKSNPDTSSKQQQSIEKPKNNTITPNKPLLVADLVSSANPKATMSIQKQLNSSVSASNLSTVSTLSIIGNELTNNSITPATAAPAKPLTNTAKPTASNSLSGATESTTLANKPILRTTTAKSTANNSLSGATESTTLANKPILRTTTAKSTANNSLSGATESTTLANKPIIRTTIAKPTANNSLSGATESTTLANKPIIRTTIAKPTANNSISDTTESIKLANKPVLRSTAAKPTSDPISSSNGLGFPEKNSIPSPGVAKLASKSASCSTEPSQRANDPTSPLLAAKSASNSTSAKAGSNYSITCTENNSVSQTTFNISSSKTLASLPISVKIPQIRLNAVPAVLLRKLAPGISFTPKVTIPKSVNQANSSKTPTHSQISTITSPVVKTTSAVPSVSKTLPPISDTPIARVIPTTICATVISNPSVAQLSAHPGSVNVYQKSPPTLFQIASSQPTAQRSISITPSSTPSRTPIPTPPSPVVISPSPPISSVVRHQQPGPLQIPIAKSYSILGSEPSQPRSASSLSEHLSYVFQPIQPSSFDTNLKTSELLVSYDSLFAPKEPAPAIPDLATVAESLKRKWNEMDDDNDEDDDDDPFFANCNDEDYNRQYIEHQKKEIENCESNILKKEREIVNLKKRIQALKKRLTAVKNPNDTKTDEQLVEEILSKYLDSDGVQFFIGQMKVSGKTYTQFRWSEDDKLFALGLLYKNPAEYNALLHKYTLPSDKTLNKFVSRVKKAEMQESRGFSG